MAISGNQQISQRVQARFQVAQAFHQSGQIEQALGIYQEILGIQPGHFDSLHLSGVAAIQLGRFEAGVQLIRDALGIDPDVAVAHYNLGLALRRLGRADEALLSFNRALLLNPVYAEALISRAQSLIVLGLLEEALQSYDAVLSLLPGEAELHNQRGIVLHELKHLPEALASFDLALSCNPGHADAHNNRGLVLRDIKHSEEALACFEAAILLQPDCAEAYNNRGLALKDLKRLDEALESFSAAQALKPDLPAVYNNRGLVLHALGRLEEALHCYDKALALDPRFAEACNNYGLALRALRMHEDALRLFDLALSLRPGYVDAFKNRGQVLADLRRLDEALASFEQALVIDPDCDFLYGTCLHTRMMLCDWTGFPESLLRLEEGIAQGKYITRPFQALSMMDRPDLHNIASRLFSSAKYPASHALGEIPLRSAGTKLRVGYYSADFFNHATAYLMAELIEAHDADRFEIHAFSFGPDPSDEMGRRLGSAFSQFIDVRGMGDREVAKLSRELGIDIAVDLKGHTKDARPGIFAERCAPIQVSYLGYPGTMGADYIDYIIADKTVIPEDSRSDYVEKVVYLPCCYQVNDSKRRISGRRFSRQELGLPNSGFVYCCFNNNYKILPSTFDVWMRILKAVDGSVLWLLEDNPSAAVNLRREAEMRGVSGDRLVFAGRMNLDEHLARHRLADLFLDTLPYNAHTTSSDALWAGLPVLTCTGRSFASRVAASLLNALALPELIADTTETYEAMAIELARADGKLGELKHRLELNRLSSPLFNGGQFARHVESAYEMMFSRYAAGLPPDSLKV